MRCLAGSTKAHDMTLNERCACDNPFLWAIKPNAQLSMDSALLSLFQGGPEQTSRISGAVMRLFKLKDVTITRVLTEEGVDLSEGKRVRDFFKRDDTWLSREYYAFALKVLAGSHKLTSEETARLEKSLVRKMEPFIVGTVRDYKAKAQAAEALGKSLEEPEPPKASAEVEQDDEKLCIICLEELRSTVYRPCKHRLCCQTCARTYWQQSRLCPFCSCEVDEM